MHRADTGLLLELRVCAEQWVDALVEWLGITEDQIHVTNSGRDTDLTGRSFKVDSLVTLSAPLNHIAVTWDSTDFPATYLYISFLYDLQSLGSTWQSAILRHCRELSHCVVIIPLFGAPK